MTPIVPPVPSRPKTATATKTASTTLAIQAWRASPRGGRAWPRARGWPLAGEEAAKRRADRRLRLVAKGQAGPPGRFLERELRRLGGQFTEGPALLLPGRRGSGWGWRRPQRPPSRRKRRWRPPTKPGSRREARSPPPGVLPPAGSADTGR